MAGNNSMTPNIMSFQETLGMVQSPYLQGSVQALFAVWCAYTPVFILTLYLYLARHSLQPIKSRMPYLCSLSAVFGYILITVLTYEAFYTGPTKWPCWIRHWTIWVVIPATFAVYPWRAFRLIMVARLADWITCHHNNSLSLAKSFRLSNLNRPGMYSNPMRQGEKSWKESDDRAVTPTSSTTSTTEPGTNDSANNLSNPVGRKRLTSSAFSRNLAAMNRESSSDSTHLRSTNSGVEQPSSAISHRRSSLPIADEVVGFFICCRSPNKVKSASFAFIHIKSIRQHIRWTKLYVACMMTVFIISALVTHILDSENSMYGCVMPNARTAITYAVCVSLVVATNLLFMIILVHEGISDNFSIRIELTIVTVGMVAFIVPYVVYLFQIRDTCTLVLDKLPVASASDAPPEIQCTECIWVNVSTWSMVCWICFSHFTSIGWPLWQTLSHGAQALYREDHVKSVKPSLKTVQTLKLTLEDTDSRTVFMKFLKSEFSQENLLFFEACEAFRTQTNWKSDTEKFEAAMHVYMKYIKPNEAPYEVNLPSKIRIPLQNEFDKYVTSGGRLVTKSSAIINNNDGSQTIDFTDSVVGTTEVSSRIFIDAQNEIFALMESDSFSRFKRTEAAKQLFLRKTKEQSWEMSARDAHLV